MRWNGTEDASVRAAVYDRAIEERICAKDDPENLVALLPHEDLDHFIETGNAIRIFRGPQPPFAAISKAKGPKFTLENLARSQELRTELYGPVWFSFGILASFLTRLTGKPAVPLGPILFKAGKAQKLATTSRLLSRDLRDSSLLRDVFAISTAQVVDLALRALFLHDLGDPRQWRQGRYELHLKDCRSDALAALERQMERPGTDRGLADYWRGLKHWYSMSEQSDLPGVVAQMRGAFRNFIERGAAPPEDPRRRSAEALYDIGGVLYRTSERPARRRISAAAPCGSPSAYLAMIAEDTRELEEPSPLLNALWNAYVLRQKEIEKLSSAKDKPNVQAIEDLLRWLHDQDGAMHLPAHELSFMRHLYRKGIGELEGLQSAMGAAAQIRMHVLTPYLDQGVSEMVRVEVKNEGDDVAYNFELSLAWQDVPIVPSTHPKFDLNGGARLVEEFQITAYGPSGVLQARWSFSDSHGRVQKGGQDFDLEVRPPPANPWTLFANPYEAGIAVYGPDRFFGREKELSEILSRLAGGITQPLLVLGPRRMGKTSILKQIVWLLSHQEELRSDIYSLGQAHLEELDRVRPIIIDLQSLNEVGSAAKDLFFSTLLERACDAIGHHEAIPWPAKAPNPVNAFRKCLGELLKGTRSRLLVMVDEWDEVSRKGLETLGPNLRSLMLDEQRVNWILSSTWIKRHEEGSGSPLNNMCHIIEVKEAEWAAARAIVIEPARRIGLHWHGPAVVKAVLQMGQLPFLIQMLCSAVIDRLNSDRHNVVEIETAHAIVGQMGQRSLPTAAKYFLSIFADYSPGRDNRDAVRAMGWMVLWFLNKEHPTPLSQNEIRRRVLEAVQERVSHESQWVPKFDEEFLDQFGLLAEVQHVIVQDEKGLYQIRIPVFRAWFNSRAEELYPQMIDRLRHDLHTQRGLNS